ncbi:CoA transferase [Novosphingobium sp.]|uniref:CoA transferase n=1 Tax=Novosphingobium sp. TaxID=1874826 RepID=UPI0025CC8168|nr:CoA transferase [Novosphingobium sp.]
MLNDLRIVEIGEGMAVQVAGLMLSELGADVLKIERPGGDPSRGSAQFANWNRGKRSQVLDLESPEGLAQLRQKLAQADVLLHQFSPTRAAAFGLGDAALAQHYPSLVVCGITGSARNHPDVERGADELLVAARLGVFYENDGHRAGPIVWRYRMGSWSAAHLAASGILTRLIMRLQSGKGGAAHTSLMQGYLSKLPMVWARNSEGPMPNPPIWPNTARAISMQLYQCQGGDWLQIMDPSQQFDLGLLPTMWDVIAEGVDIETPAGKIEAFKRRPLEQWLGDLRAADIAVEPAYPMGAVLSHDDARANGYVVEIDDPIFGKTIQPNLPFHTDAELNTGQPAPRLGEGGGTDWSDKVYPSGTGKPQASPLAGARVLDCGMFLAGPMGPMLMGDMGADVIKLEPLTGDRIRFMHRYYQAAARSKRSIAIDLRKPEAQPILARLVQWAEVVHHNMRFKGADKLGLNEETIRKYNPDVAFTYVSAYGQRGSRASWPGYDSIFNAIAGWEFENAGAGNRPVFNRPGTMDIHSAQSCLVTCMAALYVKRNGGKGHTFHTSLLGVSAFSQGETLIKSDGTLAPTYHLDSDQTGFSPWHRIYEASDGIWVAVAAHSDKARAGLRSVLGNNEAEFACTAKSQASEQLLAALEAAGVPADLVNFENAMNRFFDDPQNRELGLVSAIEQAPYGLIEQPGEFWNFGETPMAIVRAAPTIGQHTDEIMRQVGYTDEEIAAFREQQIIA